MKNNGQKTASVSKKPIIITIVSLVLAVLIIVPLVLILVSKRSSPIKFFMKNDLSKYVSIDIPDKIEYGEIKEALKTGYDVFRVGITEDYFSSTVYVEEGSTLDFTLAAEIEEKKDDGTTEYTEFELPEEYSKIEGYRPFSDKDNLFFDNGLANTGTKDSYGFYYLTRDSATKFTVSVPDENKYGGLAGKNVRFTIKVSDYVSRYIYVNGNVDLSVSFISEWYAEIAAKKTKSSSGSAVTVGDVVLYDCTDTTPNGTVTEYKDLLVEVTEAYLEYFEGYCEGDSFSKTTDGVKEDFVIKAVYKEDDIEKAMADMGYASLFELREELRIWCYAVYSDGLMGLFCEGTELDKYPSSVLATYSKLEDETWETEFRQSAASLASTWGDDMAFEAYKITGYDKFSDYLDDLVDTHVNLLVRELVISFELSKKLGVLDGMYEEYEKTLSSYMDANDYSKSEALSTLYYNSDEACIFYMNFLSPALGIKFASIVTGADFIECISDSYAEI